MDYAARRENRSTGGIVHSVVRNAAVQPTCHNRAEATHSSEMESVPPEFYVTLYPWAKQTIPPIATSTAAAFPSVTDGDVVSAVGTRKPDSPSGPTVFAPPAVTASINYSPDAGSLVAQV
jgi:hypothetical protein